MTNEVKVIESNIFESIKHITEDGEEYWYARELQEVLSYSKWDKFTSVIEKAKIACKQSENVIDNHFLHVGKMVPLGSGSLREIDDIMLSRYACYLIVQNADARKKVVAQGQTYFAIQTRRQELTDEETQSLSEDEKRIRMRDNVKTSNKVLAETAQKSGVVNFGKFNNAGYQGLYNGETATKIKTRKGIKGSAEILDYMGSTELAANWFRITQTDEKLKKEKVNNEDVACDTHLSVGKAVRKTMIEISGTAPESLPTPNKSIKQIERERRKKLRLSKKSKTKIK